jgi:aspartyl-tRNA(Asn)/glutamyl-tRNA(Gln) amidotransferase subunit A
VSIDFYGGIRALNKEILSGRTTPGELQAQSLRRIRERDGEIGAFVSVVDGEHDAHDELGWLAQLPNHATGGVAGHLFGIPFAVKDNMCVRGLETTCASRTLRGFRPVYTGTAALKLLHSGATIMGTCNMDEFAMGSSTENSAVHPTHNPWRLSAVPGGSSGGSAAAVAAGMVPFALGSDTGGSIRQPAAFCGVVGLKPTYGLVSRYGLVAFASSLDQIGPLTHSVEDAAIVLSVIAGHDDRDSTTVPGRTRDYVSALTGDLTGLRVGVAQEYLGEGLDDGVRTRFMEAVELMRSRGAIVIDVSLPHTPHALSAYYLIAPAEASSNLARFDGVRYGHRAQQVDDLLDMYQRSRSEGFGPEVKRRILIGTYALSAGYYDAYYRRAQQVRTLILQDFEQAFADVDVIVSPTAPTTAFAIGEKAADPLAMYQSDVGTIPANLAGLPAISVPCGLVDGLPVGLQMIAGLFEEATLLRAAHAYEQAAGFSPLRPPLCEEVH